MKKRWIALYVENDIGVLAKKQDYVRVRTTT